MFSTGSFFIGGHLSSNSGRTGFRFHYRLGKIGTKKCCLCFLFLNNLFFVCYEFGTFRFNWAQSVHLRIFDEIVMRKMYCKNKKTLIDNSFYICTMHIRKRPVRNVTNFKKKQFTRQNCSFIANEIVTCLTLTSK